MRRPYLLVAAFLLVFSGAAFGQTGDVALSVTTVDERPMITVTNHSSLPVAGFLVTVDLTGRGRALTRIYYDVYVGWKRDIPIPPGSSKFLPLPHRVGASAAELPIPELRAVVFSDGRTSGGTFWANDLLRRRRTAHDRLRDLLAILRDVQERRLERTVALALLESARRTREAENAGAIIEERLLESTLFSTVIENLSGGLLVNGHIPEASTAAFHLIRILDRWRAHVEASKPSLRGSLTTGQDPRQAEALTVVRSRKDRELTLRPAVWSMPPQSCGATDASFRVLGPDICGNNVFKIQAIVGQTLYDLGLLYSFGVCRGGFFDCWGGWVPPGRVEGDIDFFDRDAAPPGRVGFHWDSQYWTNQYFSCECTDPYPQGEIEIAFVAIVPTPTFYADCES